MYDGHCELSYEDGNAAYADFLSDPEWFADAIDAMMKEWPISCEHFLTKPGNRLAWIGQASACHEMGLPRRFRYGFNLMDLDQQRRANAVAKMKLTEWEDAQKDRSLREQMEGTGISGGHTGRSPIGINAHGPSAVLQSHSYCNPEKRSPDGIVGVCSAEIEVVQ